MNILIITTNQRNFVFDIKTICNVNGLSFESTTFQHKPPLFTTYEMILPPFLSICKCFSQQKIAKSAIK